MFSIGLNERIVDLYIKAVEIADEERSGFQQALSGIVMHMLGLMYYRHRTREFVDENVIGRINKAKVIKEFTGTSPAQYMQELKLNEAKRLLTTTSRPIKEISFSLKYDNPEYFSIFFKRRTSMTPVEYRLLARRGKDDPSQE